MATIAQPENLAKLVVMVRGEKVLLDTDLADPRSEPVCGPQPQPVP